MAKRKERVYEFPHWLVTALACPECGTGCVLTTSGGMTCIRVPAHTGLISRGTWEYNFLAAHALAYGRNQTTMKREDALKLAVHYLKRKNPFKG